MTDPAPPILVTGAGGFVGRRLMAATGEAAVALSVRPGDPLAERLAAALAGRAAAAVVHLGGRAHRTDAADPAALETYRRDNRDLTLELARAALDADIRRFVFVSTIGVHGQPAPGRVLRPEDAPAPQTAYARSKLEAEEGLRTLAAQGLEPVVVRPPLVCGAGAPGNLARLVRLVARGLPLPLGAVRNRRSLVEVGDLAELLLLAARHPAAPGGPFLPADPEPLSTPEIVRALAAGLGRPARLLPVPPALLRLAGQLSGRSRMVGQLLDSLEVDPTGAMQGLGWRPARGARAGLEAVGRAA